MRTRIKYVYEGPIGISRQQFRVKGKKVHVVVDVENFTFEIVDQDGKALATGGNTYNRAVLLRQAKRALTRLGYEFHKEERDRDYGVIRKEETHT